jgi:hypothetical protein
MNELCTRCDYVALCFQENTTEVDGVIYVISMESRGVRSYLHVVKVCGLRCVTLYKKSQTRWMH